MSNEEQMRADFEAWCKDNDVSHLDSWTIGDLFALWKAASTKRDEERDSLVNMQGIAIEKLNQQVLELSKQVEAANKRLEEAKKQEPVAYMNGVGNTEAAFADGVQSSGFTKPLYASPIPPADVAELQRKLDAAEILLKMRPKPLEVSDYEKRIAELERKLEERGTSAVIAAAKRLEAAENRKLAEQQAWIKSVVDELLTPLAHYPDVEFDAVKVSHAAEGFGQLSVGIGCEELNKLLSEAREEGRKDAVPDGWRQQYDIFIKDYSDYADGKQSMPFSEFRLSLDLFVDACAMLAAAPSPASLNAKEGGE